MTYNEMKEMLYNERQFYGEAMDNATNFADFENAFNKWMEINQKLKEIADKEYLRIANS